MANTNKLFISCLESKEIVVVDASTGLVETRIPTGKYPFSVAVDSDSIYVPVLWNNIPSYYAFIDREPNRFNLQDPVSIKPNVTAYSNTVIVKGLEQPAYATVPNIHNAVIFKNNIESGNRVLVDNNDQLIVRYTSPNEFGKRVQIPLYIGAGYDWFISVTEAFDEYPVPFYFDDVLQTELNTEYVSNEITIKGVNAQVTCTALGGTVILNGVDLGVSSTLASNNDKIRIRATTGNSFSSTKCVTVTVDGYTNVWSLVNKATDNTKYLATSSTSTVFGLTGVTNYGSDNFLEKIENSSVVTSIDLDVATQNSIQGVGVYVADYINHRIIYTDTADNTESYIDVYPYRPFSVAGGYYTDPENNAVRSFNNVYTFTLTNPRNIIQTGENEVVVAHADGLTKLSLVTTVDTTVIPNVETSALTVIWQANTTISSQLHDVIFDGTHYYVTDVTNNSVRVIDSTPATFSAYYSVGLYPISVSKSGDKLYVANFGYASFSVIDLQTNSVNTTLLPRPYSFPVGIVAHSDKIYIAPYYQKVLLEYDGQQFDEIPLQSNPSALSIIDGDLWVTELYGDLLKNNNVGISDYINPITIPLKETVLLDTQFTSDEKTVTGSTRIPVSVKLEDYAEAFITKNGVNVGKATTFAVGDKFKITANSLRYNKKPKTVWLYSELLSTQYTILTAPDIEPDKIAFQFIEDAIVNSRVTSQPEIVTGISDGEEVEIKVVGETTNLTTLLSPILIINGVSQPSNTGKIKVGDSIALNVTVKGTTWGGNILRVLVATKLANFVFGEFDIFTAYLNGAKTEKTAKPKPNSYIFDTTVTNTSFESVGIVRELFQRSISPTITATPYAGSTAYNLVNVPAYSLFYSANNWEVSREAAILRDSTQLVSSYYSAYPNSFLLGDSAEGFVPERYTYSLSYGYLVQEVSQYTTEASAGEYSFFGGSFNLQDISYSRSEVASFYSTQQDFYKYEEAVNFVSYDYLVREYSEIETEERVAERAEVSVYDVIFDEEHLLGFSKIEITNRALIDATYSPFVFSEKYAEFVVDGEPFIKRGSYDFISNDFQFEHTSPSSNKNQSYQVDYTVLIKNGKALFDQVEKFGGYCVHQCALIVFAVDTAFDVTTKRELSSSQNTFAVREYLTKQGSAQYALGEHKKVPAYSTQSFFALEETNASFIGSTYNKETDTSDYLVGVSYNKDTEQVVEISSQYDIDQYNTLLSPKMEFDKKGVKFPATWRRLTLADVHQRLSFATDTIDVEVYQAHTESCSLIPEPLVTYFPPIVLGGLEVYSNLNIHSSSYGVTEVSHSNQQTSLIEFTTTKKHSSVSANLFGVSRIHSVAIEQQKVIPAVSKVTSAEQETTPSVSHIPSIEIPEIWVVTKTEQYKTTLSVVGTSSYRSEVSSIEPVPYKVHSVEVISDVSTTRQAQCEQQFTLDIVKRATYVSELSVSPIRASLKLVNIVPVQNRNSIKAVTLKATPYRSSLKSINLLPVIADKTTIVIERERIPVVVGTTPPPYIVEAGPVKVPNSSSEISLVANTTNNRLIESTLVGIVNPLNIQQEVISALVKPDGLTTASISAVIARTTLAETELVNVIQPSTMFSVEFSVDRHKQAAAESGLDATVKPNGIDLFTGTLATAKNTIVSSELGAIARGFFGTEIIKAAQVFGYSSVSFEPKTAREYISPNAVAGTTSVVGYGSRAFVTKRDYQKQYHTEISNSLGAIRGVGNQEYASALPEVSTPNVAKVNTTAERAYYTSVMVDVRPPADVFHPTGTFADVNYFHPTLLTVDVTPSFATTVTSSIEIQKEEYVKVTPTSIILSEKATKSAQNYAEIEAKAEKTSQKLLVLNYPYLPYHPLPKVIDKTLYEVSPKTIIVSESSAEMNAAHTEASEAVPEIIQNVACVASTTPEKIYAVVREMESTPVVNHQKQDNFSITPVVNQQKQDVFTISPSVNQQRQVWTESSPVVNQQKQDTVQTLPVVNQQHYVWIQCSPVVNQQKQDTGRASPVVNQQLQVYTESSPEITKSIYNTVELTATVKSSNITFFRKPADKSFSIPKFITPEIERRELTERTTTPEVEHRVASETTTSASVEHKNVPETYTVATAEVRSGSSYVVSAAATVIPFTQIRQARVQAEVHSKHPKETAELYQFSGITSKVDITPEVSKAEFEPKIVDKSIRAEVVSRTPVEVTVSCVVNSSYCQNGKELSIEERRVFATAEEAVADGISKGFNGSVAYKLPNGTYFWYTPNIISNKFCSVSNLAYPVAWYMGGG